MPEPSVDQLIDLIGALYQAAPLEADGWDAALARASRFAGEADAAAAARRVAVHLRRAEALRAQVDELRSRQRTFAALIEASPVGVVLLDAQGRPLFANAAARWIGRAGDGLELGPEGLRAARPDEQRRLDRAIAAARVTACGEAPEGEAIVVVSRPSGTCGYPVLVKPVADGPAREGLGLAGASALVLIGDPAARFDPPPELVARLYGLTPAQARLACALASGDTVETYAETAGITIATARWTLKQVQARTGTDRQSELVRLLLTGPAALLPAVGVAPQVGGAPRHARGTE
jgi:DNA-binding CsgD family transcriptional regulator